MNWWQTPSESPHCNLIENPWHELKEYLQKEVKPKTKQELIDGAIDVFANTDPLWLMTALDFVVRNSAFLIQLATWATFCHVFRKQNQIIYSVCQLHASS